jgi:AcrR family transcriptional regulator
MTILIGGEMRPHQMREHILDVAASLFYEHGLRAIGVDRVIAEAGIAKATLYRHFPTKELLMVAYLTRRSDIALNTLKAELASITDGPLARIDALFDKLASAMNDNFRGCAFIRALSEHLESEPIRDRGKTHKTAVRELIFDLLEPLAASEESRRRLGDSIALLYDGALSMGLLYQQGDAAVTAKHAAGTLIRHIATASDPTTLLRRSIQ